MPFINKKYSYFAFYKYISIVCLTALIQSCTDTDKKETVNPKSKLFSEVPSEKSRITFVNTLEESLESNYYQYMYTYIGGGVAVGDLNDDGYDDIYFTSNSSEDKLYLNKGDLLFEDVTKSAGILHSPGFNTGVTMADVNADGFLDIYVSRGGWKDENGQFKNLLYINNGDMTFTEMAEEVGLADNNRTIQATFFDYDNDNDLDVYVSNTPDIMGRSRVIDLQKSNADPNSAKLKGSDKLYQNDGTGHFTDVSIKAGLQYDIGFGLNPQVGDLNGDGWSDIYVCNDFNYPDLVYMNNQDGTFTESRDKMFKHMSFNSMGSDIADIDNDGLMDVLSLDMNPEDHQRAKLNMGMMSETHFGLMVDKGYHHQYVHNMLQMNNGNGTFSEISKMAGMADTDWSWSVLAADFNLDGLNDLFITNGINRDVMNRDVIENTMDILRSRGKKPTDEDFLYFAKMLPQQKLTNYFFKNKGDRTFRNTSNKWATLKPTLSNGAAYADLDNDGDLDIVVNNINETATLLENKTIQTERKYFLKLDLVDAGKNTFGIGTKVNLYFEDGSKQTRQVTPTRGFLSAVPHTLHFGLNEHMSIKKLEIIWPDGNVQTLNDVTANQSLRMNYMFATKPIETKAEPVKTLFSKIALNSEHIDPNYFDYDLQNLLPHKLSQLGPALAKADVNGDGFEDVYVGGGYGQEGQLFLSNSTNLKSKAIADFKKDKNYEDVGAVFFDADNDGDQDLYVVSGSYEFKENPRLLIDRMYLNNGTGNFTKSENSIPELGIAGSIVKPYDYDGDGDLDLFVGGRLITGRYPHPASSILLINDAGKFSLANDTYAPELNKLGLVTDAVWADINGDEQVDLLVTGEWMGIEVFINTDNKLVKSRDYKNLSNTVGWWNRLLLADVDNDGDQDIIAGNLGLNYKFHASQENPFQVYTADFDYNGTEDIILAKEYDGVLVPIRGRMCLTQQLPHLANKINTYADYASEDLEGIIGKGIQSALHLSATEFRSGIFINQGGKYAFQAFENHVQQSPINSILFEDFDGDSFNDLILAGNNHQSEVETTRADAGIGNFLKGNGKGGFTLLPNLKTGFFADKDVRNMIVIKNSKEKMIFVANNNNTHDLFRVNDLSN